LMDTPLKTLHQLFGVELWQLYRLFEKLKCTNNND
jgi:hypothetical protein